MRRMSLMKRSLNMRRMSLRKMQKAFLKKMKKVLLKRSQRKVEKKMAMAQRKRNLMKGWMLMRNLKRA